VADQAVAVLSYKTNGALGPIYTFGKSGLFNHRLRIEVGNLFLSGFRADGGSSHTPK